MTLPPCRIAARTFVALCLGALAACAERDPDAERAAREAAAPWLATLDAGDYARCWNAAAPWFREQVSASGWAERAARTRAPLGALEMRRLDKTTYATNPLGAPDGRYVIVVYASDWAGGNIHEQLAMQEQPNGDWLPVGYFVRQRRGD